MNTHTLLWLAGAMLLLVTFGQWVLLRSRYLDGLNTPVPDGETVSIIPAVAGG